MKKLPLNVSAAALPGAILVIILLMVVPLPSFMLDVFFVLNIALSVAVLMTAMNAARPLDFSSFPSVLLFATLLRLALNVASTRVVLLKGHEGEAAAGKVIEAFGAFLIGGDFVVGIFVFLILMIINLVVVTKGAGRVSEVSARFTLDALPGKQMAIDADLAAGLVTPEEAKTRRREVATEADFYGSMDGASKFVKGDAVASILILAVNIIAGFAIGMASHGLSAGEAGERYIVLAVGDALVASVPALLLSIAAAVIVTRVTDQRDLTGQIGGQFADARIWLPVTGILFAIGCIPAMPQSVFMPFAALAFFIWRTLRKKAAIAQMKQAQPVEEAPDPSVITIEDVADNSLITLELGYGLVHLADERKGAPLVARLTGLRRQMSEQLGFVVPAFRLKDSLSLAPDQYRLVMGGAPLGSGRLMPGKMLAIDTGEVDASVALTGERTADPSFGCPAVWIEAGLRDHAVSEGYLVVDAESVVVTHVNRLLIARASRLLGHDEVKEWLGAVRSRGEALVDAVTPQPLSLGALTKLLRSLLDDGITMAHPRALLGSIAQAALANPEPGALVELVRADMGPQLVGRICGPTDRLPVLTLSARLEQLVVGSLSDPTSGDLVIEPDLSRAISEQVGALVADREPGSTPLALVVQPRARRPLALLLKHRVPNIAVLSITELPPEQPIDVIAVVGDDTAPAPQPQHQPNQTSANDERTLQS